MVDLTETQNIFICYRNLVTLKCLHNICTCTCNETFLHFFYMQMKFGKCMIQCEDNNKLSSLICYLATNALIKYRFMYKYRFDLDANLLFLLEYL